MISNQPIASNISSPAVSLIIAENIKSDEGVRELRDKLFKAT